MWQMSPSFGPMTCMPTPAHWPLPSGSCNSATRQSGDVAARAKEAEQALRLRMRVQARWPVISNRMLSYARIVNALAASSDRSTRGNSRLGL